MMQKQKSKKFNMKIKAFLSESYQDWSYGLTSVVFMQGCNLACRACHAKKMLDDNELVDEDELMHRIERKKKYIQKISISGGEATLQPGLPDFIKRLHDSGFKVKLDSNGMNPGVLENLAQAGTVDYLALDVKGPIELYPLITGTQVDMTQYERSLGLINKFPDFELRTTVVPMAREQTQFITPAETVLMAEWVSKYLGKESKWYLQPFIARTKEEMIDERFAKENLPFEMQRTPYTLLEQMQKVMLPYFPKTEIRGR